MIINTAKLYQSHCIKNELVYEIHLIWFKILIEMVVLLKKRYRNKKELPPIKTGKIQGVLLSSTNRKTIS
jgi:hypothetical protein